MRKIGYARVSTKEQNSDRQRTALQHYGCNSIYEEEASGLSLTGRPLLKEAIERLEEGDIFVIAEWDKVTRSMADGLNIVQQVAERGAMIKALDKEYLDLTTTKGKAVLLFMSALAQDEAERTRKRAEEGRIAARLKGVKFGRKPKLTSHQQHRALVRLLKGESVRDIAKDFNVHYSTISRLNKNQQKAVQKKAKE